jgi:hypothetical protein
MHRGMACFSEVTDLITSPTEGGTWMDSFHECSVLRLLPLTRQGVAADDVAHDSAYGVLRLSLQRLTAACFGLRQCAEAASAHCSVLRLTIAASAYDSVLRYTTAPTCFRTRQRAAASLPLLPLPAVGCRLTAAWGSVLRLLYLQ